MMKEKILTDKKEVNDLKERKSTFKGRLTEVIVRHKLLVIFTAVVILAIIIGITIGLVVLFHLMNEQLPNYRLPSSIVPQHYKLEFQPHLLKGNFKFNGSVDILITCVEKTDNITLGSINLTISSVILKSTNGSNDVKVSKIEYYPKVYLVILRLSEELHVGRKYNLFMAFEGVLLEDGDGFYRSSYRDEKNDTHYVALTQFEPIYARKAFPCFDEPTMKATFDITLVRWKNMTSLSNMPKKRTESRGLREWEADIFPTSMRMSTYLVAFFIGNFTGKTKDRTTIWTEPEKISTAKLASEISPKLLNYFEQLLQIPYEAPKLDMIGVHSDSISPMENWGLVIYPNYTILYNETSKNLWKRKSITAVVAHEIAHQWFGNLVTPKWWNDIWLSEGITTYLENFALSSLFPDWYKVDKTVVKSTGHMNMEQCLGHRERDPTITKKIKDFDDLVSLHYFDRLTYHKGAMIARMAHKILGNETFWKGLTTYLRENAYGNVEEKDLWEYLTDAQPMYSKKVNMTERMTSWTHLASQPIILVSRNYTNRTVLLTQVSCLAVKKEKHVNDLWHVPVTYTSKSDNDWNEKIKLWFTTRNVTLPYKPDSNEWVLINGQGLGHFVVHYDTRNWNMIAKQLKQDHRVFPVNTRYKLLSDAQILFTLNNFKFTMLLDLYLYMPQEDELAVFQGYNLQPLFDFSGFMEYTKEEDKWRKLLTYLLEPHYRRLGWDYDEDKEPNYIALVRTKAISTLCKIEHEDCLKQIKQKFQEWRLETENNETKVIDEEKRPKWFTNSLCRGIEYGAKDDWEFLYNHYLKKNETKYLYPLACSRDSVLIKRLLGMLLKKEKPKYFRMLIWLVLRSRTLWMETFFFIDKHFQKFTDDKKFKDMMHSIEKVLETKVKYDQFKTTFSKHLNELDEKKKKQVKDLIEKYKKRQKETNQMIEEVNRWLRKKTWTKMIRR